MKAHEIIEIKPQQVEREGDDLIRVGDWCFLTFAGSDDDDGEEEGPRKRFGCCVHIGSNYVEIQCVHEGGNTEHSPERVHFRDVAARVQLADRPDEHIQAKIDHWRTIAKGHMGEIKRITSELGAAPRLESEPGAQALSTMSGVVDPAAYKKQLIEAKDDRLPALFNEVEVAHVAVTKWMKAKTIPLEITVNEFSEIIDAIDGRIHDVALYAGLFEEVVRVADGAAAPIDEPLHLMQAKCFMDEECLANYEVGGVEYDDIAQFDEWLSRPENRDRVLPTPRCMVAFQVRREKKRRDASSLWQAFVNIQLAQLDELTFLYIRNGDQLHRLQTDHDFGAHLFPSREEFDFTERHWGKMPTFSSDEIEFMTDREYQDHCKKEVERQRLSDEWDAQNKAKPKKNRQHWFDNPHRDSIFDSDSWEPFDDTSVYFDDMTDSIEKQIRDYNRMSLIIQGVFDRTDILHPHPPYKLWQQGDFERAVKLVYQDRGLHDGKAPDIEAYLARGREALQVGSHTVGQQEIWKRKVQAAENNRRENDWRESSWRECGSWWTPDGDPGPGHIAAVTRLAGGKATYRWTRNKRRVAWYNDDPEQVDDSIRVSVDELFNVDAYQPGDFRQFFDDPRTRRQYLKWAHLLLAAEDFHANS